MEILDVRGHYMTVMRMPLSGWVKWKEALACSTDCVTEGCVDEAAWEEGETKRKAKKARVLKSWVGLGK